LIDLIKSGRGGKRAGAGRKAGSVTPKVAARRAAEAQAIEEAAVSAARVIEGLARVAFLDPIAYWREDGTLRPITEVDPEALGALAGFEVVIKNVAGGDGQQATIYRFRLCDKIRALELLGKHFGLFTEQIELKDSVADARVARLEAARRRVGDGSPKETN
jgi:phage terminase small subunit